MVRPFASVIELAGANQPDSDPDPHFLYALNPSTEYCLIVFLDTSAFVVEPGKGYLLYRDGAGIQTLSKFDLGESGPRQEKQDGGK